VSALEWLVRCGAQAVVLTLLVRAGGAKLGVPGPAAVALGELRPGRGPVPAGAVRTFAAAELLVALAAAVPALRAAAAAAVTVLGGCFAVAGLLGAARGAGVPCGCFGTRGTRPLGAASVALGLLFAAAGTAGLLLPAPATASGLTTAAVLLTVTASAVWLLTDHHAHARRALAAALNRTEATA
jgi:methylamine utilization protein MauE